MLYFCTERFKKISILCRIPALFIFGLALSVPVRAGSPEQYEAVPGLIDIRSLISDGDHTIAELAQIAHDRGFRVLFINDHDRVELAYGLAPFRNLLRFKQSRKSIMTLGPEHYLAEIKMAAERFPDMLIVPGCITSPYYYWTGSWFKKNLTVHEYDRRLLVLNLEKPGDYYGLPNVGNRLSLKYFRVLLPGALLYLIPLSIGCLLLAVMRRRHLWWSLGLIAVSVLAVADYNPFRSSRYSPYRPETGTGPYQEVIDYVRQRDGLSFWNYPEQRSGIRKINSIQLSTPLYPELIHQTRDHTGFSALYGDTINAIDPGREWDRALNDYCGGLRLTPPWGIATADFHADSRLKLKLGAFPTTFLVKEFSKQAVLDAIRRGRMYASFGDGRVWPLIDYFCLGADPEPNAVMGETLNTTQKPLVRFKITYPLDKPVPVSILLIRGGKLLQTFSLGEGPLEVEYRDESIRPAAMTYYRLMDSRKRLISNPIFVKYAPAAPEQ